MVKKTIKKAEMGIQVKPKKKVQRTASGIIAESGDLAEALNKYEADKKAGRVPKTDAEAKKYMDNLYRKGQLGPGIPKNKMGGKVKKAKMGGKMAKQAATAIAMKKAGKTPKKK